MLEQVVVNFEEDLLDSLLDLLDCLILLALLLLLHYGNNVIINSDK